MVPRCTPLRDANRTQHFSEKVTISLTAPVLVPIRL